MERSAWTALGLGFFLASGCAASVGTSERDGDGGVRTDAPPPGADAVEESSPLPPAACMRTDGGVRITVRRGGNTRGACENVTRGAPSVLDVEGRVTRVTATALHVDTCPPSAICDDSEVTFAIEASGASIDAFVRTTGLVRVRLWQDANFRCTQAIHVRSLPTWEGISNPLGTGSGLLFAAAEGVTGTAMDPTMDLSVNPQLRCAASGVRTCGGPPAGEYDLEFLPVNGTPSAVVPMGAAREFLLGLGAEQQRVRGANLRSFVTGACDDYWNYAWWVGSLR